MTGWMTHLLAFLVGAGIGGFLMATRGRGPVRDKPNKALRRLYKECPEFFDTLREELSTVGFMDVREFAIVQSAQITFVSEHMKFVYYEEEMPKLKEIAAELEEQGFIDDVTRGKTPVYRLRETFVTALKSL